MKVACEDNDQVVQDCTESLPVEYKKPKIGQAYEGGPTIDLDYADFTDSEFVRREKAVERIRLRMKLKSLPGYELRRMRQMDFTLRIQKIARKYFHLCGCFKITLTDAVWDGDIIIMNILLTKGQPPDSRDEIGQLALSIAIQQKHETIAKFLIDRGADINLQDDKTLLHSITHAIIMGNKSLSRRLIDLGVDVNIADSEGMTPLLWACVRGYLELIALLLKSGADPYHQDSFGWSALHIVCFKGYTEIVDYLLTIAKLKMDLVDANNFSALLYAKIECNLDIVEFVNSLNDPSKIEKRKKKKKKTDEG